MEFLNLISDENIRTQISTEFSKVLQEIPRTWEVMR
jgi:hypothetical protein